MRGYVVDYRPAVLLVGNVTVDLVDGKQALVLPLAHPYMYSRSSLKEHL